MSNTAALVADDLAAAISSRVTNFETLPVATTTAAPTVNEAAVAASDVAAANGQQGQQQQHMDDEDDEDEEEDDDEEEEEEHPSWLLNQQVQPTTRYLSAAQLKFRDEF